MRVLAGLDIGGTKCAVAIGEHANGKINVLQRIQFPTLKSPSETIGKLISELENLQNILSDKKIEAIGISCGGPLDNKEGIILSPPNLPGWDEIHIVEQIQSYFKIPVSLENDANAGALAEWKWGAGLGTKNMIFLTFGTGMGAGLILNGQVYSGANNMAGEVGHIRLQDEGPMGYGKKGSFEGFCSGGGIKTLAATMAKEAIEAGRSPSYCMNLKNISEITSEKVGLAAQQGDELALEVFNIVGLQLGRGLSILIDILNPELIVLGTIYSKQQAILEPIVMEQIRKEALDSNARICEIKPASFGASIGDVASLAVALQATSQGELNGSY